MDSHIKPVCDIKNLDTLTALHEWATIHHTTVTYLGPTLENLLVRGHPRPLHTDCSGPGTQPSPTPADVAVPPGTRVSTRRGRRNSVCGNTVRTARLPTRPTAPIHTGCAYSDLPQLR